MLVIVKYKERLSDCGMISVEQTPENRIENGHPVIWGGLRMVRYCKPRFNDGHSEKVPVAFEN
jgi:hypothetical protein